MNRARFSNRRDACRRFATSPAWPAVSCAPRRRPQLTPVLAGKKFTPPLQGSGRGRVHEARHQEERRQRSSTTIKVKNMSAAPIARLTIAETWYDKGGAIVGGEADDPGQAPSERATWRPSRSKRRGQREDERQQLQLHATPTAPSSRSASSKLDDAEGADGGAARSRPPRRSNARALTAAADGLELHVAVARALRHRDEVIRRRQDLRGQRAGGGRVSRYCTTSAPPSSRRA